MVRTVICRPSLKLVLSKQNVPQKLVFRLACWARLLGITTLQLFQVVHANVEASRQHAEEQNRLGYELQQQADAAYLQQNGAAIAAAAEANRQAIARQISVDNANRVRDWWGAYSLNLATGATSWGTHYDSAKEAMQGAQATCANDRCSVLSLFRNTCVASAIDDQGRMFWADHVKPKTAQRDALTKCKAEGAAKSCQASKNLIACSGYAYQKYDGKLSNFNRGGLLAVIAPKTAGIPDVAAAQVMYNPTLVMFTAQSPALRTSAFESVLAAALDGKPRTLWGAVATGDSSMGLGMGITSEIAKADALKKCTVQARTRKVDAASCAARTSIQGDFCLAIATGIKPDGKTHSVMDARKDQAMTETSVLDACDKAARNCKLSAVTQCVDLTTN
jgi:Domain of unknown function (DUF4189)